MKAKHAPNMPRPTLEQANAMLAALGWTPSAGCWESENVVFAFSQESYPGTYGGAAAAVTWNVEGWLATPESKPKGARFV